MLARRLATLSTAAALAACTSATTTGGAGAPRGSATTGAREPVVPIGAVALSADEARMRDYVRAHHEDDVSLLERAVNIPSGSQNVAGVRRVGELFGRELSAMGFTVRLSEMPASMRRGPHLIAERTGTRGPRLLLIGHLDTVFEGEGQKFTRTDSIARGAGTSDMKGGDVAMIAALRAMHATGALEGAQVSVIMTGDEESVGSPREVARRDLIELAQRADYALAFEGGGATSAVIARRGSSGWSLNVTARQGHSSGVFSAGAGNGAIYESARILDAFRRELGGDPTLTFNPGLIAGGTDVVRDTAGNATASGKTNIIAPKTVVQGDLRFLRETQKDSTRARMRAIVAQHLNGAEATIAFTDGYPAMPPTPQGQALLARFDAVSRSLGWGPVTMDPPESRGAGDVSFVAPYTTGLDGLGVSGRGAHSPDESVNLNTLNMAAERAAVLMHRLLQLPRPAVPTASR